MTTTAIAPPMLGSTTPRLSTPPLVELSRATSYGYEVIDFANEIGRPLLPWQEEAVIRGGELLPDGRPRFRVVLLLVSRQNGKTELPVILSVFWQFRQRLPLVLGTSTQLKYAKESWEKAVRLVRNTPAFDVEHEEKWTRRTNGETESWTLQECRYLIAAANAEGGRSLTIDRGIVDELRQHRSYEAWDAMEPACSPAHAQIWCMSNAGDDRSVVLNDLRDSAVSFIETGEGDYRLGLLEWSAPDGAEPDDVEALLQANPRIGYGLDLEVLLETAKRAKTLGGATLAGFRTERMCQRVKIMNPAIDPDAWKLCEARDTLKGAQIAACIDLSLDGQHATLAVAGVLDGGYVRVETVKEWVGPTCATDMQRELPAWIEKLKPKKLGWFPTGPAAAVTSGMADRKGWPPRGVEIEPIRGETPAVVMGFAKEVNAKTLVHSGQAMLDSQVAAAEPLVRGDAWVLTRKGGGQVDAVYAVAGAVHLARTMPVKKATVRRMIVAP